MRSAPLSLGDLAEEFAIPVGTAGRHVTELLRQGLVLGTGDGESLAFRLTPRGRDRLYHQRVHPSTV